MTSSRNFRDQGELTGASITMLKGKVWELKKMLALGEPEAPTKLRTDATPPGKSELRHSAPVRGKPNEGSNHATVPFLNKRANVTSADTDHRRKFSSH